MLRILKSPEAEMILTKSGYILLKTTLTMRINSLMKLRKQAKNSHGFRIWGETGMNSISVCKVSQ